MQPTTDAPDVALTIDEKEQWIRDMLVQEGRDAWDTGQNVNWRIGRAAVEYVKMFAADTTGDVDEKKKKPCLKEFAISIGMYDNTHYIYDLHKVAAFWPEDAQAHFKDATWSRFRECSRHGLTLSQASTIMHQHGEAPVAKIRKAILERYGKPSAPRPVTVSFEATMIGGLHNEVTMRVPDNERFWQLIGAHANATITVTVTYTPVPSGGAS